MSNIVEVEGVHEILMNQLPYWFKPVIEYIEIMRAWAGSLAESENLAESIKDNFFIQTADSDTLAVWEKLLGISSRPTDTLEFRRERILSKLNQTVPFTYWHLKERLTDLFGDDYRLTINPAECKIEIFVTSDRYGAIDLLNDLIYNVIPAHLDVKSNQEVRNFIVSNQYIASVVTNAYVQTITANGNAFSGGITVEAAFQSTKIQRL